MRNKVFICALLWAVMLTCADCSGITLPVMPSDDLSTQTASESSAVDSSSSHTTEDESTKTDDSCKLLVKGKDITADNYVKLNYEYRYAELPLTAILKESGASVKWQDKSTAQITFGGKDYHLDATKGTMTEVGGTVNILSVAPGSEHGTFYKVVDGEFIIDSDSAKLLIINIMQLKMTVDFDKKIVNIG